MKNFEKNDFIFDNEDMLKTIFITSHTQPVQLVQCHHNVHDGLIMTTPFVSIVICSNGGHEYITVLEVKKYKDGVNQKEKENSLKSLYQAFEAGFKAKYDDYKEIKQLALSL